MDYQGYRKLSASQKASRISSARILQQNRGPNPLGNDQFPDQNFLQFRVHQNGKKIKLHTYRHNPAQKPKGIIFMFHGLNAHIGQGAHLARCFAERGFATVGFDHRGFGQSEGEKGYIDSLEEHLGDSKLFIKLVEEKYTKEYGEEIIKLGLGLSMGGMTVYYLALENPKLFNSVILMAPALMHNLPTFVPKLSNLISSILPKTTRLLPPFADKSNRNPTVCEYRKADPYCFSSRAYLSTMDFIVSIMSKSQATFKNFRCPFLVVQGGLDKLVNPDVAFRLYDQADLKKEDKKLIFYQGMWHGIWHQQQIWEIIEECIKWFESRVKTVQKYS